MITRLVRRLTAAVVLTAAVGPGLALTVGSAPAAAAACSTSTGVSVIVDFKELGGGVQGTCVADGAGQRASSLFPAAGFPLSYVQSQPGFVCRVSGKPADEPCADTPPDDAYWGLWWSDGKSGTWTYANYGASSLKVPAGASVAFAWKQGGGSSRPPGVGPPVHRSASPSASPTRQPSSQPTRKSSPQPSTKPTARPTKAPGAPASQTPAAGTSAATPSTSATPSGSATPTGSASASATPSGSATPTATDSAVAGAPTSGTPSAGAGEIAEPELSPAADRSTADEGVPLWLVLTALGLVLVATGAVLVHRRRSAGTTSGAGL